jgi:hypothetical protein
MIVGRDGDDQRIAVGTSSGADGLFRPHPGLERSKPVRQTVFLVDSRDEARVFARWISEGDFAIAAAPVARSNMSARLSRPAHVRTLGTTDGRTSIEAFRLPGTRTRNSQILLRGKFWSVTS